MPEDFGEPLFDNLRQAFESGKWAVDWWEGDPTGKDEVGRGYFVRPKTKYCVDKIYDPSWGGECIFLTIEEGCELSENERPAGCRLLEPKENGNCISHGGGKRKTAIAWMPYHEIIHQAVKAADKKEWFLMMDKYLT